MDADGASYNDLLPTLVSLLIPEEDEPPEYT
jgi:hypothetical protein